METLVMKEADSRAAAEAVKILRRKGVIVYPTETQYGIGADATSREAVRKVFEAKRRQADKKVIWAFSDLAMIKKYFTLDKGQKKLVKKLMPGPFTLVAEGQGFRIPDNAIARKIIRKFGRPVTTTSANISGKESPGKIKDVMELFDGKVDLIVDAGNIPRRKPSTVFRWEDRKILRRGPVGRKEIMRSMK